MEILKSWLKKSCQILTTKKTKSNTSLVTAINAASSTSVISAGTRLATSQRDWPFVTTPELINGNGQTYIESKFNSVVPPSEIHILSEYLALSTITHALDGWRFLSKAIYSILNGARKQTVHLAYYAELRAAMAVLAESGIAISNEKNFSLDDQNNVHWFCGGTHVATWDALKVWSGRNDQATKALEAFTVMGLTGIEWADVCGVSSQNTSAIVAGWLNNWSIDLKRLKVDKYIRNIASYRINLSPETYEVLTREEFDFIKTLASSWTEGGAGFIDWIDLVLIFHLCQTASKSIYGDATTPNMAQIYQNVRTNLEKQNYDLPTIDAMIGRLESVRQNGGTEILRITEISNESPIAVIGRAFLLLRLTGALTKKQWEEMRSLAPVTTYHWQKRLLNMYAKNSNFLEVGNNLSDFSVLFSDQNDANEDLNSLLSGLSGFEPKTIWETCSEPLTSLCRFERLGILAVDS